MPITIDRKVRLRPNQTWTDKIMEYFHEKPYYEWRVATYNEGVWEDEELYEAKLGTIFPGENPRLVYEHEVMSQEEYDEWTTMSGADPEQGED